MPPSGQIYTEPIQLPVRKTWFIPRWLKILLTVAVLGLLVWQVRWSEIAKAIGQAQVLGVVAAIALWSPNQWLQYVRWKLIAKRANCDVPVGDIRASYWLGHTLGFITPGRVGAFGRGFFLKTVPIREATALTVLERIYSALTVNGLGLVSLGLLPQMGWEVTWASWSPTVSIILISIGTFILLTGILPGHLTRVLQSVLERRRWGKRLSSALAPIASVKMRTSLLYMTLAAASLTVSLLQFVLLLHAFGSDVAWLAGMLTVQLNFFLKGNIPLTLGNLGVGEWTALLCLRGLGVPDAHAVAASLLLFAMNVAGPALIGMRYLRRVFTVHHDWSQRVA